MKITEILKNKRAALSFEVFPPKTGDAFEGVVAAVDEIAALNMRVIRHTFRAYPPTVRTCAKSCCA